MMNANTCSCNNDTADFNNDTADFNNDTADSGSDFNALSWVVAASCEPPGTGYNLSDIAYPCRGPREGEPLKLILTGFIFSVAAVGNSLVIFLIWLNPSFHSAINCYLLNLAGADLLITFVCMWPHTLVEVVERYPFWPWFCQSSSMVQATCVLGSVLTLAVVSLERVHAVLLPLRPRRLPRQHLVTVCCVWAVAAAGASPFLALKSYQEDIYKNYVDPQCRVAQPAGVVVNGSCVREPNFVHFYHITFSTLLFFLPVTVMTLAYARIVAKLWSIRVVGEASACASRAQNSARKKVVALSCALLLVFTLCWGPLQVLVIHASANGKNESDIHELQYWLTLLGYSNSAINPIIYVWFSGSFRQELVSMIAKGFRQRSWGSHTSSLTQATRTSSGSGLANSGPHPRPIPRMSHGDLVELKQAPAREWSRNSWRDQRRGSSALSPQTTVNGDDRHELCVVPIDVPTVTAIDTHGPAQAL